MWFLIALLVAAHANKCPGSGSWIHASCQVTVTAGTTCANVMEEMQLRVNGQANGAWVDPHNGGHYHDATFSNTQVYMERETGNKKYNDKMIFTLNDQGSVCEIQGCSESQVTSIADFSTNYCNMRMMYCGSNESCKPVKHDYPISEKSVSPSTGAGKDPSACIPKAEAKLISNIKELN